MKGDSGFSDNNSWYSQTATIIDVLYSYSRSLCLKHHECSLLCVAFRDLNHTSATFHMQFGAAGSGCSTLSCCIVPSVEGCVSAMWSSVSDSAALFLKRRLDSGSWSSHRWTWRIVLNAAAPPRSIQPTEFTTSSDVCFLQRRRTNSSSYSAVNVWVNVAHPIHSVQL